MEIGSKVRFQKYPEYSIGKIIDKKNIFGEIYYEVLFTEIGKIIQVRKQDLELVLDPAALLEQGMVCDREEFQLKAMAHLLETYYSGDTVISSINFKIKPLPHQILALNFVLNMYNHRCLLADEVGLGKTIEAALIFEELKLRGIAERILIITPAGLTRQWQEELHLKFSEDFYLLDSEKARALQELHGSEGNLWFDFNQVITSIDYLKPKRLSEDLSDTEYQRRQEHNEMIFKSCVEAQWDVVIFDEAHKLTKYKSGNETSRYKLGAALAEASPVFLLITATPHSGKPDLFQNLLKLIDPQLFYKKENLRPDTVRQVTVRNKKGAVVDMQGNRLFKKRITMTNMISWEKKEDAAEEELYYKIIDYVSEYYNYAKFEKNQTMILLLMLYQRILSSSSRAILKTLEKRYKHLKVLDQTSSYQEADLESFLDLKGEEQVKFFDYNKVFLRNPNFLKKELKIIEDCIVAARKLIKGGNDAKFRHLLEVIDLVIKKENNPKVKMIIFTEFIETQNYLVTTLQEMGYQTAYINGNISLEEKITQKDLFRDEVQFLVSTDAGGEGINLQFCCYMINYDLPWNPMKLEQRVGRIDRIGQKEDVKVFNFILAGTIEEHVRSILEEKLTIIKKQFGEDKLRDILSTLQEDFNFDQIFFENIVIKDKNEEKRLESLAQDIYNKAQEIVKGEDFLLPFTEEEQGLSTQEKKLIDKMPEQIKRLIVTFLSHKGIVLKEYFNHKDLYYFTNHFQTHQFKNHYSKVIFTPAQGLNKEEADLFSLKHKYVQQSIVYSQKQGFVSAFTIQDSRFQGKEGLLTYWLLIIENNFDYKKKFYIPIFIEKDLCYNRRISRLFEQTDALINTKQSYLPEYTVTKLLLNKASKEAEKEAEDLFLAERLEWQSKLEKQKKHLKEYFQEKEKIILEIKIENIREGRLIKMREEWKKEVRRVNDEAILFPKLNCEQIAYLRFG